MGCINLNSGIEKIISKDNMKVTEVIKWAKDLPLTKQQSDFLKIVTHFQTQLLLAEIESFSPYEEHGREIVMVRNNNFQDALIEMKRSPFLGFDMEAKPTFRKGQRENKTSIIQIATLTKCFMLFVVEIEQISQLRSVMENRNIVKLGIGLGNDKKRLRHEFKFQSRCVVDISEIFHLLGRENSIGSKQLVALTLRQYLTKNKSISRSNWASKQLTPAQISYASDDSFSSLDAYMELQKIFRPYKNLLTNRLLKLLRLN